MQIVEKLKDLIDKSEPNTAIPSERSLEKELNASRMTVRKAIDLLVEEGYLYRVPNIGTFVADRKLHKNISEHISFRSFENRSAYRILNFKIKDNADIANILEIDPREQITQIIRLNLSEEGQPESIDEIYLNKKVLDENHLNKIQDILEFGSKIDKGSVNQRFMPMIVPLQYANLLKTNIGTPIICVESRINLRSGKIIAYMLSYCNPAINIEVTL